MNESWFNTEERVFALRHEALSWIGTPFAPRCRIKGHGVDCISLVAGIFIAVGFLDRYEPPSYTMDGGNHLLRSLLEDELLKSGKVAKIWSRTQQEFRSMIKFGAIVLPGDIAVGKRGGVTHHAALILDTATVVQAVHGPGVIKGSLLDPIIARGIETIWRPIP